MGNNVFYLMDYNYLQAYTDLKNRISAGSVNLSDEVIGKIKAQIQEFRADGRELFTVDEDGAAHITVAGPLEPKPDPCAILFDIDMTTYGDIIDATRAAEADNNITKIVYHFATPGGNVVGLFRTADIIRDTEKPTLAVVHDLCASAGYALAAQCDSIEAENMAAEIGSIGVATEILDRSGQDKARGITRYILTSENAPNKRPDVTTDAGRDKIIKRLTDIESVFIDYVSDGRNATAEDIKNYFGKGGVLIAGDALSAGMIDGIISNLNTEPRNATVAGENQIEGETDMGDITMSEEQFQAAIDGAATKAATAAVTGIDEKLAARDEANAAENTRKAGFTALAKEYPKQEAMINAEMAKEGATADATFAIKVAQAETARIAAEGEQKKNGDDKPGKIEGKDPGETDETGNMLAASLGLKVGGTK